MTEDEEDGERAHETEREEAPLPGTDDAQRASAPDQPSTERLGAPAPASPSEEVGSATPAGEEAPRTGDEDGLGELAPPHDGARSATEAPWPSESPLSAMGGAGLEAPDSELPPAAPPADEPPTPAAARVPHARARMTAAFLVGVFALALVVALQHVLHGWPFSLHHGTSSPAASLRPSSAPTPAASPRAHVELAQERWSALGVRVEPARLESMGGSLRAVVTIVPDESRLAHVHTRVSGWIDRLYVRTTGEQVRAGQALCAIFSQELLASQTEYLAARRAMQGTDSAIARGARERLRVLGMTEAQISALERRGAAERLVTVVAPRAGVVLHRGITEGTAIDPSTELYTIGDLSTVWALTEVPEVDAARVGVGSRATLDVPASGGTPLEASIAFVYPTLSERTRTLRARFVVPNEQARLLPGMYGTATFQTDPRPSLVVPRDALVDTGVEQHVFVLEGQSTFVPRQVRVGRSQDSRVEILDGLREAEPVAASGVFLLDSESRLRASGQAGTGHAHGSAGARRGESEAPAPPGGHAGHGGAP